MNDLQKVGGAAALIEAATYLVGIVVAFTILAPTWEMASEQYVAFLVENQTFMHIWHLIIYVVNGVFLAVLVVAINDRLKGHYPALSQVTAAIGLIWAGLVIASGMLIINDLGVVAALYETDPAQAATIWTALSAVEDGLGGAVELPGGLWIALVSWAALQSRNLPKALNYLGLVVGGAGILTAVPTLGDLGAVFGLGSIVWFLCLGVVMLRGRSEITAGQPDSMISVHTVTVE